MLQAIEWEPSGQFLKMRKLAQGSDSAGASGSGAGPQEGGPERRENNRPGGVAENVIDPSLPPNPHKYLLYRPTVPQLLLVRAASVAGRGQSDVWLGLGGRAKSMEQLK